MMAIGSMIGKVDEIFQSLMTDSVRRNRLFSVIIYECLTLGLFLTGATLEPLMGLSYPLKLITSIGTAIQAAIFCFLILLHCFKSPPSSSSSITICSILYIGTAILRSVSLITLSVLWISHLKSRQLFMTAFTTTYFIGVVLLGLLYAFVTFKPPSINNNTSAVSSSPSAQSDGEENSDIIQPQQHYAQQNYHAHHQHYHAHHQHHPHAHFYAQYPTTTATTIIPPPPKYEEICRNSEASPPSPPPEYQPNLEELRPTTTNIIHNNNNNNNENPLQIISTIIMPTTTTTNNSESNHSSSFDDTNGENSDSKPSTSQQQ